MTLKALVNVVENNKNFTVDQKWVFQNSRKEEKMKSVIITLYYEYQLFSQCSIKSS
jgi:hypothetical protein